MILTVENVDVELEPVDNVVARVRRKFDKPGLALDTDTDFDSWKRRKLELHGTVGHGLRGQGVQGAGDDKGPLRARPLSVHENGLQINLKNNINHDIHSKSGGVTAGVQHGGDGHEVGDAGVHTAQCNTSQQRDPRMVGSFLVSGEMPDNAAAGVGKLVLLGESHSTKFAP